MAVYMHLCFLSTFSILIGFLTKKISAKAQYTIAVTATSMLCSLGLIFLGYFGYFKIDVVAKDMMQSIDFKTFLINGILGFLLFAGALSIRLPLMKTQWREITALSLFSTLASTLFIGFILHSITLLLGWHLNLIYCFLFGAIISPTDPIAVLAIIKNLKAPQKLSMKVEGESLFNDGVGLVIFTTIFAVAFGGQAPTVSGVTELFLKEAIGGVIYGAVLGYIVHLFITETDDASMQTLLTLIIPTAGYMLANLLEVSGALSMVISGIIIGNWSKEKSTLKENIRSFEHFWELVDQFLNSLLFLLIGFAMLLVDFTAQGVILALCAIPVCLFCRYMSVYLPFAWFRRTTVYNPYTLRILTWGGLRGGLSLAMALSIPSDRITLPSIGMDLHDLLVVMTYTVVLFAILIQGTTIEAMIRKSKESTLTERGYINLNGKHYRAN